MNAIVSQRLKVSPQFFHTFGETFLALSCCEEHCFAIDLYQEKKLGRKLNLPAASRWEIRESDPELF